MPGSPRGIPGFAPTLADMLEGHGRANGPVLTASGVDYRMLMAMEVVEQLRSFSRPGN